VIPPPHPLPSSSISFFSLLLDPGRRALGPAALPSERRGGGAGRRRRGGAGRQAGGRGEARRGGSGAGRWRGGPVAAGRRLDPPPPRASIFFAKIFQQFFFEFLFDFFRMNIFLMTQKKFLEFFVLSNFFA